MVLNSWLQELKDPSCESSAKTSPAESSAENSQAICEKLMHSGFRNCIKGRIYHETYGCQMNINDMEIILSIMKNSGYKEIVPDPESAEVIFVNTCAIRENAEQRVWQRLNYFWFLKREWKTNVASGRSKSLKPPKVVVLGCMAERLKEKILDSDKMFDARHFFVGFPLMCVGNLSTDLKFDYFFFSSWKHFSVDSGL